MPALPPPSMQIAGLPNGAASVSTLPAGPSLGYGFLEQPPQLVQQMAGASSAAAPGNFTLGGISATQAGTCLVFLVAAACSGAATISTPTGGWTLAAGATGQSANNNIAGRVFVLPNNPGGITSVAIATLAAVNGIATWFGEFSGVYAADAVYGTAAGPGRQVFSNTGTTPAGIAYAPNNGPLLLIGLETDVTGQAYTPANIGGTWVAGTTATSTLGATNCIIRPFWTVTLPLEPPQTSYQLAGSLAGALANGVSLVSLLCGTSGPLTQAQLQGFPSGAAVGGAWGALGGTKPGGAGSGQ